LQSVCSFTFGQSIFMCFKQAYILNPAAGK